MSDPASQIGEKLERARKRAGLSRAQVAKLVGVDQQTVYRWERDRRRVPGTAIVIMLDAYGMDARELGLTDLGTSVPRGTIREPAATYESWSARVAQTEREAIRLGATDAEADLLTAALLLPQARAIVAQDGADEAEFFRSALAWIVSRVESRKPLNPVTIEDEGGEDVTPPAALARRTVGGRQGRSHRAR